jgi:hypothetical protein
MRRFLNIVGWSLFALFALCLDLVAVMSIPEGKDFVRFMVEKGVGERFKGEVELGSFDYSLGGTLELRDLRLKAEGKELLHVRELRVELGGLPTPNDLDVALVEVIGVRVRQGKGFPRLEDLLILPEEKEEPIPKDAVVSIHTIRIQDVDVEDLKPDGTLMTVSNLDVHGSADVKEGRIDFEFGVPAGQSSVRIDRADGGTFSLPNLELMLKGTAKPGHLMFEVMPTQMALVVDAPGLERVEGELGLKKLEARVTPTNAQVDLKGLQVADITLKELSATLSIGPNHRLVGEQSLRLTGLEIPRRIIQQATGQDATDGPVQVDFEGRGPAEKVKVTGLLTSGRGNMSLTGLLNLSQPQHPSYEIQLSGRNLAPRLGDAQDSKASDVDVTVEGQGILPGETDAKLTVQFDASRFGLPIERVRVEGKTDGDTLHLEVGVLDHIIRIQAERDRETNTFKMALSSGAELTALLGKLQSCGIFKAPPVPLFGDDLKVDIKAEGGIPETPGVIPEIHVTGSASAKGVRSGPNSVEYVTLTTDIRIANKEPKGTIQLRLLDGRAGLLVFKEFKFTLTLDGTAYALEGKVISRTAGEVGSFRVHGVVDLANGNVSATLDSLEFQQGPIDVSLDKPVTFEVPPGLEMTKAPVVVPPLRLRMGQGWIDLEGLLHFASRKMEGQEHEVLILEDSDFKLSLHDVSPALPNAHVLRFIGGKKPRISGDIRLQGSPDKPKATVNLRAALGRYQVISQGKVTDRDVDLRVEMTQSGGAKVGGLTFKAPLRPTSKQPIERIHLDWYLDHVALSNFLDLDALGIASDAHLEGKGQVRGTLRQPKGNWHVKVAGSDGKRLPAFTLQSVGSMSTRGRRVTVQLDNEQRVRGMPRVETRAEIRFAQSPLLHPKTSIEGSFEVSPISLAQCADLSLQGRFGMSGRFKKRGRRVEFSSEFQASNLRHPSLGQPLDVSGRFSLDKTGCHMSGQARTGSLILGTFTGGIHGDVIRATQRRKLQSLPLSLTLETPTLSLRNLRSLLPALPPLEGNVGGRLRLEGVVTAPKVEGEWQWSGFKMASGGDGEVLVQVKGDGEGVELGLEVGTKGQKKPLRLQANLTHKERSLFHVETLFRAQNARVDELLPSSLVPSKSKRPGGTLDGELRFGMDVDPSVKRTDVTDASGSLRVALEQVALPGTSRVYKQVRAVLKAQKDGLEISPLLVVESDVQENDRRLKMTGKLRWDGFKPTSFKGDMTLRRWLAGGPLYAPHAQLDADIRLSATLDRKVPLVEVEFTSFRHEGPKRFIRDHYQEAFGENDVVYIDDEAEIGKLPPSTIPFPFNMPAAGSGSILDIPLPAVDLRLAFTNPAHLNNVPLFLNFTGELAIKVRPDGVSGTGSLDVSKGSLALMGHPFAYKSGAITMDGPIQRAAVNLTFERAPNALACRDARGIESGCEPVNVTLNITPLGGIKLFFKGASGPFMVDAMALQNSGQARWKSGPGQSTSATVQFPQMEDYMVISFVMSNLQHLTGLDRYRAWADPSSLDTYGQMTRYEAQRLLSGGKQRLQLRGRPDSPGQNQVELGYDLLFENNGRNMFGLGFLVGDELHAGAELFYEWSSAD